MFCSFCLSYKPPIVSISLQMELNSWSLARRAPSFSSRSDFSCVASAWAAALSFSFALTISRLASTSCNAFANFSRASAVSVPARRVSTSPRSLLTCPAASIRSSGCGFASLRTCTNTSSSPTRSRAMSLSCLSAAAPVLMTVAMATSASNRVSLSPRTLNWSSRSALSTFNLSTSPFKRPFSASNELTIFLNASAVPCCLSIVLILV
mmetsp:Transcript_10542/g.38787  ORF Transcript_10542/g.38787 Transcript_10542/m.38787 type:complete len:208 (+) Transcript_10542:772-1395(+)